jgi:hypothetical protein
MSDRETFEALAARCEKATGPDRELDADICCVGPLTDAVWVSGATASLNRIGMVTRHFDGGGHGTLVSPGYTASVDAALALVPEGALFDVGHAGDDKPGVFQSTIMPSKGKTEYAEATAPALALCAAALRARAANA